MKRRGREPLYEAPTYEITCLWLDTQDLQRYSIQTRESNVDDVILVLTDFICSPVDAMYLPNEKLVGIQVRRFV